MSFLSFFAILFACKLSQFGHREQDLTGKQIACMYLTFLQRGLNTDSYQGLIWVANVTPTDRPKSVRNRCVIEVLVACVLSCCFWGFPVGVGVFVTFSLTK